MITPLKGDDQIDREGTVRLTEHILAGGVHALFLLADGTPAVPVPQDLPRTGGNIADRSLVFSADKGEKVDFRTCRIAGVPHFVQMPF